MRYLEMLNKKLKMPNKSLLHFLVVYLIVVSVETENKSVWCVSSLTWVFIRLGGIWVTLKIWLKKNAKVEALFCASKWFTNYSKLIFSFPLDDGDAKMTSRWQKFRLLMWKNYLLQWRHPFQTILEIAIPVLFSALLVLIRSLVTPDNFPDPLIFPELPLSNITQSL